MSAMEIPSGLAVPSWPFYANSNGPVMPGDHAIGLAFDIEGHDHEHAGIVVDIDTTVSADGWNQTVTIEDIQGFDWDCDPDTIYRTRAGGSE